MKSNLPCPCCGFLTICENVYGTYSICPICEWEDDAVQLANPGCPGGANSKSLIEAQATALQENSITASEIKGISRDPKWRPLNSKEIDQYIGEKNEEYWKNAGNTDVQSAYWIRNAAV